MASLAQIRGYAVAGAGSGDYTTQPSGASGTATTYVKFVAPGSGDIIYYAFSLEALQVIAKASTTDVPLSSNTNIHWYTDASNPAIIGYYSKQAFGVLQTEAPLFGGSGEIIEYISFQVPPPEIEGISDSTTYQLKYYTNSENLTEVTEYGKYEPGIAGFINNGNGILTVFNETDLLRAAIGKKISADGITEIDIVSPNGIIKYVKPDGSIEYYQKASGEDVHYFKQVEVDETTTPITITAKPLNETIWREYGTPDAIDIEAFAIENEAYPIGAKLYSGGLNTGVSDWTSLSGETVRLFEKVYDNTLVETVSSVDAYFIYANDAFKYAVENAAVGAKIVDLRDLGEGNHMSDGAGPVGSTDRKRPSRTYSEQFEVHLSKVLVKNSIYYNYADTETLSEKTFSLNYSNDDSLYYMAAYNASSNADMSTVSSAFKRTAYALLNVLSVSPLGTASTSYRAYNQNGLKNAANLLASGDKVIEQDEPSMVSDREWFKYSVANALKDASGNIFITFHQEASLGSTEFPVSRQVFASNNTLYEAADKLIQRLVTDDTTYTDVESIKLGTNAVNKVGDLSNSYAYSADGLVTAARSADSKEIIKQVTAADYHLDGSTTDYARTQQNVLKRTVDSVVTYFEYNNMATLSLKKFATNDGATYNVGEVLKRMNTSTGAEIDSYTKKFADLMSDATSSSGNVGDGDGEDTANQEGNYYYAYADISGIINAPEASVELGATIIETSRNNEPSTNDVAIHSYIKTAVGLAQMGSSTVYHAYSQIGMYSFAVLSSASNATVTEGTTGFYSTAKNRTATYTWQSQNILRTGSTYLTFTQGTSALSEQTFGTIYANGEYEVGAVLLRRSLAVAPASATSATTASDVTVNKISHDLTKASDDVKFHAWSDIGRLNAAINTAALDAEGSSKQILQGSTTYDWIEQYVLQQNGASPAVYFEYSNLSGNTLATSTSTTPSALSALTLREIATNTSYDAETQLNRMQQDGEVNETFIKKYDDIMQEGGGDYYAYTVASLATIANDADLPKSSSATGAATRVWQIDENDNEPVGADTLWLKIEQYVLRAASDSTYIYRSYSFAAGTGISLPEFACKVESANDVTEFGTGDQLIDVSGAITYTRVAKSVLTKSDDVIDGSANVFYVYSFAGHVGAHLALKEAATNASIVANGSILKTESEGNWTKEAHNIVSQPEGSDINYRTFGDVSGYLGDATFGDVSGYLGDATFATTNSYAVGSVLREVRDVNADSQRYLKVLASVLYNYETDLYKAYAEDGLKNAAQATDLSENRNRTPGADYRLRPQLIEIEVGAFIKDMSAEGNRYLQRTERNVLLDVDLSGSTLSGAALRAAELAASFSASSPAHYYDYSVAGQFGTFTLEELATGSFAVGTLLTDMITSDGTFEKKHADVILRESTDEYYTYSSDISGTEWVAKNGVVGYHVMEKFSPVGDASRNYLIADRNVLAGVDISGADNSAGNSYNVPATTTFFAYNLASDVSGIRLVSFAWKVESPIRAFTDGDQLRDRTSQRMGTLYTISASQLLKRDPSPLTPNAFAFDYMAFGQDGLANFAAKDLSANTVVQEQAGLAGAWAGALDASGNADGANAIRTGTYLEYRYVSLNVLKRGLNTDYYVYKLDSDVSGLTLNTFATSSSYPKSDTLTVRHVFTIDGVANTNTYDGPVYTKVIEQGVLRRQANSSAIADAALRTYDNISAATAVLGLRNASLAAVSDISDDTVLIPEIDCPLPSRTDASLLAEDPSGVRRLRCSTGLLRLANSHAETSIYIAKFMAFEAAAEPEDYLAAIRQAAKDIDAAGAAITDVNRQVAAESKIYVTLASASAYRTTIDYTKDNATNFPDTLRVGDKAVLEACDKITFADYVNPLRDVMINFCEFDASGVRGDLNSSKAGLYAGKSIQNYSAGASLPIASYKVVRRGLMSVGTEAGNNLEYYTFSDKGLVAAAVAAEKNSDGKFSFVNADGDVEEFRRVAKGLLVSNSRLDGVTGETTPPTAAIMYFADYDSTADDDKANMYFYLYSLATLRGVDIDLSGSSTTGDSKTYSRDANGVLQAPTNASDNIIDFIRAGSITTLYSIVSLVGDASGNANYGAEKYETMSYVLDGSNVEVPNAIKVTPIDASGAMITEDNMTGLSGESFYVAYAPNGMTKTPLAAEAALGGIANAPLAVIDKDAFIYLGDKYSIDASADKLYTKIDEGSLRAPNGRILTYSFKGLRAFAHLYDGGASLRSTNMPVGVSGEATDASGVYTQYLNYVYYWLEKGVVVATGTAEDIETTNTTALTAATHLSDKPTNLAVVGAVQRYDVFYEDASGTLEPSVQNFIQRAALADISGASGNADFNAGAYKQGARFFIHNTNNVIDAGDKVVYKVAPGLMAMYGGGATNNAASYTYYAFNDYALAFGANDESVVNGEPLLRMENADIMVPVTNDWSWQASGLLKKNSPPGDGEIWRLYTNGDVDFGRQYFALNSSLGNTLDYYTYESPDTTTLIHAYTNVLEGDIANHDLSGSPLQAVSVLKSDASGADYERDPATNPDGYLTYGNAGLALLANGVDLSGTSLKDTTYKVLPISSDQGIADDLSGSYQKLQLGAMYTGRHMVLYDESKFEEIMDREDITDFATMDANNSYASTIVRATLHPVPLERVFVPDVSGNNQGSALIFETDDVVHGVTTYLVEKVLERDLLGSYAGSSEYVWTTNLMTLVNEQQQPSITTRELEVTNKNGNKQTYRNRTWLRPTDIQG